MFAGLAKEPFADLASVVGPEPDYPAFWRSMMRLAHELSQNGVAVVYFSVMLPEQVLVNSDLLAYFDSVQFLCLTCPPDVLRERIARRDGGATAAARTDVWVDFDAALTAAAGEAPTATLLDAGRAPDVVEHDLRHWIDTLLSRRGVGGGRSLGSTGAVGPRPPGPADEAD